MKRLSKFIHEKRKNPDKNIKYDSIDIVKLYYKSGNAENMHVTFTDVNKVGINPHSRYNTPNGIYSYPLKSVIDFYKVEHNMKKLPFAGDAKFMTVFQIRSKTKMLFLSKYKESDWKRDYKKLKEYESKHYKNSAYGDEKLEQMFIAFKKTYKKKGLKLGDKIDIKKLDKRAFVFSFYSAVDPKYASGLKDTPDSVITDMSEMFIKYYHENSSIVEKALKKGLKNLTPSLEPHRAIAKLWSCTRKLANWDFVKGGQVSFKWNTILRKVLGYEGIVDDKGFGVIHPSEKLQAVHLTKSNINVVQTVNNTFHDKKKKAFFDKILHMQRTGMVKKVILPSGINDTDLGYMINNLKKFLLNSDGYNCKIKELTFRRDSTVIIDGGQITKGDYAQPMIIKNANITGGTFFAPRVENCHISGGIFNSNPLFDECTIGGVSIDVGSFTKCDIMRCKISRSKMWNKSASLSKINDTFCYGVTLNSCTLTEVECAKCELKSSKFIRTNKRGYIKDSKVNGGEFTVSPNHRKTPQDVFYNGSVVYDVKWNAPLYLFDQGCKWYDGTIQTPEVNDGKPFQTYRSPFQIKRAMEYFNGTDLQPYLKDKNMEFKHDLILTIDDMKDEDKAVGSMVMKYFNKLQEVK